MKNKKIPVRHGDINFHPVDEMKGEIVKHEGLFVVGYGETTGHKHVLVVEKPQDLIIKKDSEGNYYFELLSEGKLKHEEHKTITMPPGIYKKFQEEEVDHFMGSIMRKVID
jgi:hypothetical protein